MASAMRIVIFFSLLTLSRPYGNRPLSDEAYDTIVSLVQDKFSVPVKSRTPGQKAAIVRYYRERENYELVNGRLYLNGLAVAKLGEVQELVKRALDETKGSGKRKLQLHLRENYVGISEDRIQQHLDMSEKYQKVRRRFRNKPIYRPITAAGLQVRHQIDLLDMHPREMFHKGKKYRYIMTLMDIFSRYCWARALTSKSSREIADHLLDIYSEVGPPRIMQHDRGMEFEGAVKRLMVKMNVKIIRSSPYHPQSQGKVERSHRTLRQKVKYDLISRGEGVNWVENLHEYVQVMNDDKRKQLGYLSAFEVFYGRKNNRLCYRLGNRDPELIQLEGGNGSQKTKDCKTLMRESRRDRKRKRLKAKEATHRCHQRMIDVAYKKCPPSVYETGDRVFVRIFNPKTRPIREYLREGTVEKRNLRLAKYKVNYKEDSQLFGKWFSVKDVTSITIAKEKTRPRHTLKTPHNNNRKQYYIVLTGYEWLDRHGFEVRLDPPKDGDCQFTAIADQLATIGIYRSAETLRKDIVQDMLERPFTVDGTPLEDFVGDMETYANTMATQGEYGDHVTLQWASYLFNVQFIVFSALGPQATTLISPTGVYDDGIPTLWLGHGGEGINEHYVSLHGTSPSQNSAIALFTNDDGNNGNTCDNAGFDRHGVRQHDRQDVEENDRHDTGPHDRQDTGQHDRHDVEQHDRHDTGLHDRHDTRLHDRHKTGLHDVHDAGLHDRHDPELHDGHNTGLHVRHDTGLHDKQDSGLHDRHNTGLHDRHDIGLHDRNYTGQQDSLDAGNKHGHNRGQDAVQDDGRGEGNNHDKRCENRSTSLLILPPEILVKIIGEVLNNDLGMACVLRKVHPVFRDIANQYILQHPQRVRRYNRRVHVTPGLLENLRPTDQGHVIVSVQRLAKRSGRHSGLISEVKRLLEEYKRWWTSWLVLVPLPGSPDWYRIDDVFWRR